MTPRPPTIPGYDYDVSHDAVRPPRLPQLSGLAEMKAPEGSAAPPVAWADMSAEQRREAAREWGRQGAAAKHSLDAIIRRRIRHGLESGAPTSADVERMVEDAWLLFCAQLKELPNDGQHVRSLLALKVQHETLAAWWQARVFSEGVGSAESVAAEDRFSLHSRRVEQLTASVFGAAKALAAVELRRPTGLAPPTQAEIDAEDDDAE